jgi:hypothetical protein
MPCFLPMRSACWTSSSSNSSSNNVVESVVFGEPEIPHQSIKSQNVKMRLDFAACSCNILTAAKRSNQSPDVEVAAVTAGAGHVGLISRFDMTLRWA